MRAWVREAPRRSGIGFPFVLAVLVDELGAGDVLGRSPAFQEVHPRQAPLLLFGHPRRRQNQAGGDGVDPEYPWSATFYGDKGTLKASVHKYDYFPRGKKAPAARVAAISRRRF